MEKINLYEFSSSSSIGKLKNKIEQSLRFEIPTYKNNQLTGYSNVILGDFNLNLKYELMIIAPKSIKQRLTESFKQNDSLSSNVKVKKGWLRDNVDSIALLYDVTVVWHPSIPKCVDWQIKAPYTMDSPEMTDVFAYLFDKYPLVPRLSTRDRVLHITPTKSFEDCEDA